MSILRSIKRIADACKLAGALLAFSAFAFASGSQGPAFLVFSTATDPATCIAGSYFIWSNTTTHLMKKCENGSISQIGSSSGTGITDINGLTAASQTLAIGTSGTAFAIGSVTATHTFQTPGSWFTWNNTNKGLTLTGTTAGYALSLSTATTDGLYITRTTNTGNGRTGIVIDPMAGKQATVFFEDAGVAEWLIGKQTDNSFFIYNAPNNINQMSLTAGTLDTGISTFQGNLGQTRTTTQSNGAVGLNATLIDNNTTGTGQSTQNTGAVIAVEAGRSATQQGNLVDLGLTNIITATSASSAPTVNEFALVTAGLRSDASNGADLWGLDLSVQSSRAAADQLISGVTQVVNRFNTGANANGSGGVFIYTKPNSGATVPTGNPTTYPVAVGLQVIGWSGATSLLSNSPSNATLQSRTSGFTTGILIGGAGSGWDQGYMSDRSRIGTGLAIQDVVTYAIDITNPYGGTSPPTPGLFHVTGTTWGDGIDLSGATFANFGLKMGASLLDASSGTLKPPAAAGATATAASQLKLDTTAGRLHHWDANSSADRTVLDTADLGTAHALYAGNASGAPTAVGPDSSTTKALFSAGSSADPVFRAIAAGDLPASEKVRSCQPAFGDGLNAITAGTYLVVNCYNDTGATLTVSSVSCYSNDGTSTLDAKTDSAGSDFLTGPVTCGNAVFTAGTQSATVTLASGHFVTFTFVASGTSTRATFKFTSTL